MSKKQQTETTEVKKGKPKVVYYDDGSTIADMSGTRKGGNRPPRIKSTMKEKARTFFGVMKAMVVPMLCTLAALTVIYLLLLLVSGQL